MTTPQDIIDIRVAIAGQPEIQRIDRQRAMIPARAAQLAQVARDDQLAAMTEQRVQEARRGTYTERVIREERERRAAESIPEPAPQVPRDAPQASQVPDRTQEPEPDAEGQTGATGSRQRSGGGAAEVAARAADLLPDGGMITRLSGAFGLTGLASATLSVTGAFVGLGIASQRFEQGLIDSARGAGLMSTEAALAAQQIDRLKIQAGLRLDQERAASGYYERMAERMAGILANPNWYDPIQTFAATNPLPFSREVFGEQITIADFFSEFKSVGLDIGDAWLRMLGMGGLYDRREPLPSWWEVNTDPAGGTEPGPQEMPDWWIPNADPAGGLEFAGAGPGIGQQFNIQVNGSVLSEMELTDLVLRIMRDSGYTDPTIADRLRYSTGAGR